MAAAADGDRDARRRLFEVYREVAYRVARRITGQHDDALDVVQNGFIKAFEKLADFQRDSSFKTWLLRIVTNQALDWLRSRKVRFSVSIDGTRDAAAGPTLPAEAEHGNPGGALERAELSQRLQLAIDALPADQRSVFVLHAAGDMTYGQIAEILGIPVGTVMSRLYHARRRLRERLPDLAPPGTVPADDQR